MAMLVGCSSTNTSTDDVPPAPSVTDIQGAVNDAQTKTVSARQDVQTAIGFTERGDARSAGAPLNSADGKLAGAIDDLSQAHQQIEDLKLALKARDDALLAKTIECEKRLEKMRKENEKLKNQFSSKIRRILGAIAAAFIGFGVLCCASKLVPALAFFPGLRIGIPMLCAGFVMVWVTIYFNAIVFWTGIALGVALLGVIAYALIHTLNAVPPEKVTVKTLMRRKPLTPKPATDKTQPV